jgi:large subunit ribosomal protein L23
MSPEGLILAPVITEKGTSVAEKSNQVVFRVRRGASKHAIRHAVEELFKVRVVKVRTSNVLGKTRRRAKILGRQPDWKKAYVTLREGDRIEFFEGA